MVILTTGFCEIEFSRTFSLLLLPPPKNTEKFKLKFRKCQKVREIQMPKLSKSAGKFKLPKRQKVRGNLNSSNVKKCGKIQIPQIL